MTALWILDTPYVHYHRLCRFIMKECLVQLDLIYCPGLMEVGAGCLVGLDRQGFLSDGPIVEQVQKTHLGLGVSLLK